MTVFSELAEKNEFLAGIKISEVEAREILNKLPSILVLPWFIEMLRNFSVVGACFSLDEANDKSGLGVEMKWLSPNQMIEEALLAYPGKKVLKQGYIPIGSCLLGSGDPYFLKIKECNLDDPFLVRIPHDFASCDHDYPVNKIEVVCEFLSEFINRAEIY